MPGIRHRQATTEQALLLLSLKTHYGNIMYRYRSAIAERDSQDEYKQSGIWILRKSYGTGNNKTGTLLNYLEYENKKISGFVNMKLFLIKLIGTYLNTGNNNKILTINCEFAFTRYRIGY